MKIIINNEINRLSFEGSKVRLISNIEDYIGHERDEVSLDVQQFPMFNRI